MNNIHKVIFNKTTQQYVVVSELAKSAGKAKAISADSVDIVPILQNFSEKRPLVDVPLFTSGQILAKNRIDVEAKEVTFDTAQNSHQYREHSSDLKMGQFSRVISPIIDLVQSIEKTVKNKEASDRVKAAQAMGLTAQGYTLFDTVNRTTSAANSAASAFNKENAVLFRAETGTGYAHSRSNIRQEREQSLGNVVNAKHINIRATEGNLTAKQTDFTANDENGNRQAGSSISLTAKKDLNLLAGESYSKAQNKSQSSGVEVGTAVSVGAKTGWSVYGKVGYGSNKQNSESHSFSNTHLDAENITLTSGNDTNLIGATAKGSQITANVGNALNIESLQDRQKQSSRGVKAGAQVEFGIGSSWQFSLNGSAQSGKSNYNQVNEQAGLFAEEGGYHVTANHVQLNGGAIASQNAQNSELTTNTIAFQDLKNESNSKAISGSLSASANRDEDSYVNRQGERVHPNTAGASKVEGKATPDFGGGLPMYETDADSGITKATLTEGRITLNKDTNPTQVTAKELGINTELNHAHQTVSKPKDVNIVLEEQNALREAMAQVSKAAETYSRRQADSLNKEADELAKQGKEQEAAQKRTEAESWQTSGANKRKVEAVTTAITMATAGKPTEAIAVGAASPYVNQAIKDITKESETANIAAHVLWGAIEAELSGNKAQTGAVAAATAELGARALTQAVYNKAPEDLTPTEKATVLEISKAMAGVAVGVTDGGNAASVVTSVKTAADVAERAVENNLLITDYSTLKGLTKTETEKHRKTIQLLKDNGIENIDDYAQLYANCSTEQCKADSLAKLNTAFDKAYDKIDELAKSGQLTSNDINAIDEYVTRVRSAYDSKRFSDKNSGEVYSSGVINVLGKNEDRLNQARLYATVSDWALRGYSQEQIEEKLKSENFAISMSSSGISLGSNTERGVISKKPTISYTHIKEIVTKSSPILKQDGYYYANGMKISENYYDKLWRVGRPAPFIQAREILNSNPKILPDDRGRKGFYRYESNGLEMIYNPTTREIWHIQPMNK